LVVVKDVYWEIVGNKAMTEFKFREEFIGGMGNAGTTLGTAVLSAAQILQSAGLLIRLSW